METPRFIYYVAASLDGYIADRDGGVDWLSPFHSADYGMLDFMRSVDCIVLGRTTYEQSLTFGPPPGPKIPRIVISASLKETQSSFDLVHSLDELLDYMRVHNLRNGWMMGGGQTASRFVAANLLNELRLFTMPVILGAGVPLFSEIAAPTIHRLQLSLTKQYDNGVVERRYTFPHSDTEAS